MSASSLHMMEDAQQSQYQHQQELDHMQIRDEEIQKLLTIYIDCAFGHIKDSYAEAEVEVPNGLKGIMRTSAKLCVIRDDFKDINLG